MIWTRSWCYFHCATTTTTTTKLFWRQWWPKTNTDCLLAMTSWLCYEDRCHEHLSSCQDDSLSSQTPTPDFVDRGHLDRENDILGRQVLNKSWSCYEDRCLEYPSSCLDNPLSCLTPSPDFVDGGHLGRENDILVRQGLNKSWWCNEDRCPDHPSSCKDDPLSSQILFNKSDNTKQTNNKTSHSNSIEELDIEVKTNLLNILKFNSTSLFWLEAIKS